MPRGAQPGSARWFSTRLTNGNCKWLHCRGEPFRVIAALELYATLFGIIAFVPENSAVDGRGIITGSAATDNKGNTYAVAGLMSTKFPLNALLMELSEQMDLRGSWLRIDWAPREQNTYADALTNEEFHNFDATKRVEVDPAKINWIVLEEMIEAGGGLAEELKLLKDKRKEERQARKDAKRRRKSSKQEALKVRDPW